MRPIIGVTAIPHPDPSDARRGGRLDLNWNYAEAIHRAGGSPIILTPHTDVEGVVGLLDGWLIPGGDDMDARHFGQATHPACELQDPARFAFESALYRALPPQTPILGICYGCQFLNVMAGGTLHQHLPEVTGESHTEGVQQHYGATEGSLLARAAGTIRPEGQSWHHQAADRVGEGLVVSARAEDGTVEAIEDPRRPFLLAVQWHPERTPERAESQGIMRAFVEAAAEFRGTLAAARSSERA